MKHKWPTHYRKLLSFSYDMYITWGLPANAMHVAINVQCNYLIEIVNISVSQQMLCVAFIMSIIYITIYQK